MILWVYRGLYCLRLRQKGEKSAKICQQIVGNREHMSFNIAVSEHVKRKDFRTSWPSSLDGCAHM